MFELGIDIQISDSLCFGKLTTLQSRKQNKPIIWLLTGWSQDLYLPTVFRDSGAYGDEIYLR